MDYIYVMAIKFSAFALSILLSFVILRRLDRMLDVDFKVVIGRINENPQAAALYFGARLVAVAIIGAAFLG